MMSHRQTQLHTKWSDGDHFIVEGCTCLLQALSSVFFVPINNLDSMTMLVVLHSQG